MKVGYVSVFWLWCVGSVVMECRVCEHCETDDPRPAKTCRSDRPSHLAGPIVQHTI